MTRRQGRRSFGYIRELPSRRFQASYLGDDGRRYTAKTSDGRALTFSTRQRADAYLGGIQSEIERRRWTAPERRRPAAREREQRTTLHDYAWRWLEGRDLSKSTQLLYAGTLRRQIDPAFGSKQLSEITPAAVHDWYSRTMKSGKLATGQRQRDAAYTLLRTIMGTALKVKLIDENPCTVERSAKRTGTGTTAHKAKPATPEQVAAIAAEMPARYQLMVILAGWCGLRFGELTALQRGDVDTDARVIHVSRGAIATSSGRAVKDSPKSAAGVRDVVILPALIPLVDEHLAGHVGADSGSLLFPGDRGGLLAPATLKRHYYPAREAAGRPDLRFHDLRHTASTAFAQAGATLAELMARLGHSTVYAAMIYQHAGDAARQQQFAAAMSPQVVVPISAAASSRARRKTSRSAVTGLDPAGENTS